MTIGIDILKYHTSSFGDVTVDFPRPTPEAEMNFYSWCTTRAHREGYRNVVSRGVDGFNKGIAAWTRSRLGSNQPDIPSIMFERAANRILTPYVGLRSDVGDSMQEAIEEITTLASMNLPGWDMPVIHFVPVYIENNVWKVNVDPAVNLRKEIYDWMTGVRKPVVVEDRPVPPRSLAETVIQRRPPSDVEQQAEFEARLRRKIEALGDV